jgi:hypothetical protein
MSELEFNILLDGTEFVSVKGFESGSKVNGARIYDSTGNKGVAKSIEAVQNNGLIQVPTYIIANGRILADVSSPTWQNWIDTHAERNTILVDTDLSSKYQGLQVVDIQNGGLFINRPQIILDALENRNGHNLQNGAIKITQDMKNLLFKDGMVYSWNNGKIEPVKPDFVGNYNEFLEASKELSFLAYNEKKGRFPIYVVFRSAEEARQNPSVYRNIETQRTNPDLIIPIGSVDQTNKLMDVAKSFGWTNFGSWNDGYTSADRGRQVIASSDMDGLGGDDYLIGDGGSVGVAPEALRAFYDIKKNQQVKEK